MNRALAIPALCCVVAFSALLVVFQGAAGRETNNTEPTQPGNVRARDAGTPATSTRVFSTSSRSTSRAQLSTKEAEQLLNSLATEYLRPWRELASSPRHLYSRVAPRPIPSISACVELCQGEAAPADNTLLATIAIRTGTQTQSIPCVVDRTTQAVRIFADGKWLTEAEWVKKAPLP